MNTNRLVASLFTLNGTKYTTCLDNRSRRNFKKLVKDWAGAEDFSMPKKGDSFEYLPLKDILKDIESTYKGFEKTPATEKLVRDVHRLIDQIRVQNDYLLELSECSTPSNSDNEAI